MERQSVLCIMISVMIVFFLRGICAKQPPGYIGCYKDKIGKSIEAVDFKQLRRDATGTTCKDHCRSNKAMAYRYAGVKQTDLGLSCYCGNVIARDITPTKCEEKCRGDENEYCGGAQKIILYDTWLCATLPCKNGANCTDINADKFVCVCADGWTGVDCDEDQRDTESTAVNISIPVMIAIACVIVVVVLIILRRRRAKQTLQFTCQRLESPQPGISVRDGMGVANNAYSDGMGMANNAYSDGTGVANNANSEDHACSVPSKLTYNYAQVSPSYQYAEISRDGIQIAGDITLPKNGMELGTNIDHYMEIQSGGIQTGVTESNTSNLRREIQPAVANQYSHLKLQPTLNIAKSSGYSHMAVGKPIQNSKMASMTYSHTVSKQQPVRSQYNEDNTYNSLQSVPHSNMVREKKYCASDEETEYDHAQAGGQNPKMDEKDEYWHLNLTQNMQN